MRVLEFGGGLGDVYLDIWNSNLYTQLEVLPPDEKVQIVLRSANPGVKDLFTWHPKASQFQIFEVGSGDPWGDAQRMARGIGEPTQKTYRNGEPLRFYPSPEEVENLGRIRAPYVVFALSAGWPSLNIPAEVAEEATKLVAKKGATAVLVGRTYTNVIRNFDDDAETRIPREEVRLSEQSGLIDAIDYLTVPGVVELVSKARAVFACHSSTMILSWLFRRPTFALYHETKKNEWEGAFATTFGKNFPESLGLEIGKWDPALFQSFLDEHVK